MKLKTVIKIISYLILGAPLAYSVESALYNDTWIPPERRVVPPDFMQDKFIQDFSYAGYRMGEASIPANPPGDLYDVTAYGADSTGSTDSRAAIQAAIDACEAAGGGVVYFPEGIYWSSKNWLETYFIKIESSNVVLAGDGVDKTFFYGNNGGDNNRASLIAVEGASWDPLTENPLAQNYLTPTTDLELVNTAGLAVGDWIIITHDTSEEWVNEHGMTGEYEGKILEWQNYDVAVQHYRKITAINGNTISFKIPTRYYFKTRDNARVSKFNPDLFEFGVENMSLGLKHSEEEGWEGGDYEIWGTGAYFSQAASLVRVNYAIDCWVRNVESFTPPVAPNNTADIHMPSLGIRIMENTRNITVQNCDMSNPRYIGGGGNGNNFSISGQDHLVRNCSAAGGRHSYSVSTALSSGIVFLSNSATGSKYTSDFHRWLSQACLVDNTVDDNGWQGRFRPYAIGPHGHTITGGVFWNCDMEVTLQQWGFGYAIGCASVDLYGGPIVGDSSVDHVEATGLGSSLDVQSLYLDQLSKRLSLQMPADGKFNEVQGDVVRYNDVPGWWNLQSDQRQKATRSDESYDGSQNGVLTSVRTLSADLGYTIVEGDILSMNYVWLDSAGWVDQTDKVKVSLFVTDSDRIGGVPTYLSVMDSPLSTQNFTWEYAYSPNAYTADATYAGKKMFVAIDAVSTGFGRIDNFEIKKVGETLIGGSKRNGDFNSNPGSRVKFADTPFWEEEYGASSASCTRSNWSYDGSQNAIINPQIVHAQDLDYTIQAGDIFDLSYVWLDHWRWVDNSSEIVVSLFVTDSDTIEGIRTNLAVHKSGKATVNDTWEAESQVGLYTAGITQSGKNLFIAIESDVSVGSARLDDVVLKVRR